MGEREVKPYLLLELLCRFQLKNDRHFEQGWADSKCSKTLAYFIQRCLDLDPGFVDKTEGKQRRKVPSGEERSTQTSFRFSGKLSPQCPLFIPTYFPGFAICLSPFGLL